jgi:hypothetical protein
MTTQLDPVDNELVLLTSDEAVTTATFKDVVTTTRSRRLRVPCALLFVAAFVPSAGSLLERVISVLT